MASQNIADIVPSTACSNIVALATAFQKIVSIRSDLRIVIVDRLLQISKPCIEGAILTQIKLVSLTSVVQNMDMFIKSHCRALEIPAVLDQAVILRDKWTSANLIGIRSSSTLQ